MVHFRILAAVTFLALLGSPVCADRIDNATGLASPATTLDFDEWGADGVTITDQYISQGVVFTSTPGGPVQTLYSDIFPGMDLYALNQAGDFEIQFQGTVDEAAFAFLTNPGTSTFTALRNGSIIDSFSAYTEYVGAADYFGFSNFTFDTIRVSAGGTNGAFRLDNLQFGAVTSEVPEPGTLALVGLLLAGVGLGMRRRSASIAARRESL